MNGKPRRDRYRFPETSDSRIAMVATLALFLVVILIFIVIIFRQGTLTVATPTPEGSGLQSWTAAMVLQSLKMVDR